MTTPRFSRILALFCASGIAALIYEIAWVRLLTQLLGHSAYAVTAVLSAYMGGLAAGSLAFGRLSDRVRNPLALYGRLEIGIGVAALAVPFLVDALVGVYVSLYRQAEGALVTLTVVRFGFALVALAVPTVLMGGTFPALAAAVLGRDAKVGRRAGWLYGLNTLGAVLGCILAGFVLIEAAGVRGTTTLAAVLSIAVGAAALWMARGDAAAERPAEAKPEIADPGGLGWILAAAAVSGFAGLALEVLWTRILAMFFASITYAFSAMLATFLAGIALGGVAGGYLADRVADRRRLLAILLAATGVSAGLSLAALRYMDPTQTGTHAAAFGGPNWWGYLGWLFGVSSSVMTAPTLCLGALFPVVLRCAADARGGAMGEPAGRVYAANALGAIVGPPVATYLLLPALGSLVAAVAAVSALPLLLGGWLFPRHRSLALAAAILAAAGIGFAASGDGADARTSLFGSRFRAGQTVLYHEEGPTTSTTVVEEKVSAADPGRRSLFTDSFRVAGIGPDYAYMRMLGHLPALLAPERKNALVVGFGTGTTAGALSLHPFEHLDVVEIAPEVLRAAHFFEAVNRGIADGKVVHPEVRIFREDGRNHLLATETDYDVITAEPPLPYLAGAVNLYSRDFYRACRERLSPAGIVCQWMPMHGTRPEHYRQMLASFRDVFPDATLWYYRSSAIAIGTMKPLQVDYQALTERLQATPSALMHLAREGLGGVPAILAGFMLDPQGLEKFVAGAPVVTDDRPTLEFFGQGEAVRDAFATNMHGLLALRSSVVPYLTPVSDPALREFIVRSRIEPAAGATGHAILAYTLEMEGKYVEAAGEYQAAIALNPGDRATKSLYQVNLSRLNSMGLEPPAPVNGGTPKEMHKARVKLETLLAGLQHEDGARRMEALQTLREQEEKTALPEVLARLEDPVRAVRLAAVFALGKLGGAEQIPLLEKIAGEGDPEVSVMAHTSLVELGQERHLETLQKMVRDIDPKVRSTAMWSLLNLRDAAPVSFDWLDERLNDRDLDVQKRAVMICGKLGDPVHIPALREALKSTNWMMRAWVSEALGEIGHPDGVPILLTCLEDTDAFVRKEAGAAIRKAAGHKLPFDADADETTRAKQVAAWKAWWGARK